MVKVNSQRAKKNDIKDKLVDRPYEEGQDGNDIVRVTITLSRDMRDLLDGIALHRKRNGRRNKNVSAIIREALEKYFNM